MVPYWLAQIVAGFVGAAIVYVPFGPAIDHFKTAPHLTGEAGGAAGVFFTQPGRCVR